MKNSEVRNNTLKTFGDFVRTQRLSQGLSQEELEFRSGLDRTYISGVECGKRNPSLIALVKLSEGLSMTVSELLSCLTE